MLLLLLPQWMLLQWIPGLFVNPLFMCAAVVNLLFTSAAVVNLLFTSILGWARACPCHS